MRKDVSEMKIIYEESGSPKSKAVLSEIPNQKHGQKYNADQEENAEALDKIKQTLNFNWVSIGRKFLRTPAVNFNVSYLDLFVKTTE